VNKKEYLNYISTLVYHCSEREKSHRIGCALKGFEDGFNAAQNNKESPAIP